MNTTNIFDLLITLSGAYLVYAAIIMKKDGKIVSSILPGKDVDANKLRDKEGFIKYMFGKLLLLGVLTLAAGIIGMVNTQFGGPVYISIIGVVIVLAVLIVFSISLTKARKRFIE